MSSPMAALHWKPGRDALTIAAEWPGTTQAYTIYWGDGTSTPVSAGAAFTERAMQLHTYAEAGSYDVVAVSVTEQTASARVTVRTWSKPPVPGSAVAGQTVTLTFPGVVEPVSWLVDWGDDTSSEHTGTTAEHTYDWNFGAPKITMTDSPSRRSVTFTGPNVGPEPEPDPPVEPVPEWTFHHSDPLPGGAGAAPVSFGGTFYGRNLKPGVWYGIRQNWTGTDSDYAWGKADSRGRASATIPAKGGSGWIVQSPNSWGPYRFCCAWEEGKPRETARYIPIINRGDGLKPPDKNLDLTYAIEPSNTRRVQLQVQKPQAGTYRIDWGDGKSEEYVCGDDGVWCVWHTYGAAVTDRSTITVTFGQRQGKVTVGRVDWKPLHVARNDEIAGVKVYSYTTNYSWGTTQQMPVLTDWGEPSKNLGDGIVAQLIGFGRDGQSIPYDFWYRNEWRGKTVTVTQYAPLTAPVVTQFTVPQLNAREHLSEPDVEPPPINLDGTPNVDRHLTAEFTQRSRWNGGYSGTFTIRNNGPEVHGWRLEFALDGQGVLREVWSSVVHDVQFEELGAGRWRLSSSTPLGAGTAVDVSARVEPPGSPNRFPQQIQVTPQRRNHDRD